MPRSPPAALSSDHRPCTATSALLASEVFIKFICTGDLQSVGPPLLPKKDHVIDVRSDWPPQHVCSTQHQNKAVQAGILTSAHRLQAPPQPDSRAASHSLKRHRLPVGSGTAPQMDPHTPAQATSDSVCLLIFSTSSSECKTTFQQISHVLYLGLHYLKDIPINLEASPMERTSSVMTTDKYKCHLCECMCQCQRLSVPFEDLNPKTEAAESSRRLQDISEWGKACLTADEANIFDVKLKGCPVLPQRLHTAKATFTECTDNELAQRTGTLRQLSSNEMPTLQE